MAKPTLNVLEACSRLALSEGQKEDKRIEERKWKRKERYLQTVESSWAF